MERRPFLSAAAQGAISKSGLMSEELIGLWNRPNKKTAWVAEI